MAIGLSVMAQLSSITTVLRVAGRRQVAKTLLIAANDLAEKGQQISFSPPMRSTSLVPASAPVPAATKKQNEDQNNDEKRSGVHVYLRVLYFALARTIHSNFNQCSGPRLVPS
jgi:hypothetical protein